MTDQHPSDLSGPDPSDVPAPELDESERPWSDPDLPGDDLSEPDGDGLTPAEGALDEPTDGPSDDAVGSTGSGAASGVDAPGDDTLLLQVARAHGVATEYWDWRGEHVLVPSGTVRAVLAALDVDTDSPRSLQLALREAGDRPWSRMLPPVLVVRQGVTTRLPVHVTHGESVAVSATLEDGGVRDLAQMDHWVDPRPIQGRLVGEASFEVPGDLPLGWHQVHAVADGAEAICTLVVTPAVLAGPALPTTNGQADRAWGFMTQLYGLRSRLSWGLGDLADLTDLAAWSGADLGADFVLVNPMHSAQLSGPMEPSPYLPTTRRFVNPVYLRVEDIPEVAYMPAAERQLLEWAAEAAQEANATDELDRDVVWEAKRSALEAVYRLPRTVARDRAFERFAVDQGEGLVDFATWCALAEVHGPRWPTWPTELHDPASPAVAAERERLAERVDFYCWLQWTADEQLEAVQRHSLAAGMRLGIVHDMAVGVHPEGADAWSLGPALARGVSVGAPPDAFNQQGQGWSQPPWRPDVLADQAYGPYRDMLRTVLRHAGGLRVDHVMGLFRLWWVPDGVGPTQGTYVRYDHEALVGILALEAHRAGAFVVGEDLGVVEPWVRDHLRERGILGTSVLWFEKDESGAPLPPEQWRRLCLATVTTHDLPPTAGYLAGEHVTLRDRLGLLTRSVDDERQVDEAARARVLDMLRARGLLGVDGTEREAEVVEALHRLLTWTPSVLVGVALPDAVGDRRAVNQPGTDEEYPNWRFPLADPDGHPILLEELLRSRRARALTRSVALG